MPDPMIQTLRDLAKVTTEIRVRGRLGRDWRDGVQWGPMFVFPVYLQRRGDFKGARRLRLDPDEVVTIAPRVPLGMESAEYSERDYVGNRLFMVEDYFFEIVDFLHSKEAA